MIPTPTRQVIPTGTPLDPWLGGGLPKNGLVQVRGPQAVGKSTFLLALAMGFHENGSGLNVLTIVQPRDLHLVGPRSWVAQAFTVEEIARALDQQPNADVVLIDEVTSYGTDVEGLAAVARLWAQLIMRERDRRVVTVMTGTVRRRAPRNSLSIGQAADFSADVIIDLAPVARTASHPGTVVEASLGKSRYSNPEEDGKLLLWLRPRHTPPMTRA